MTLRDFIKNQGLSPGAKGSFIHKGNENNMYLVKSNDGEVTFESIVEPTVEEVDLTPDTEIRDRPWYFEPSISLATSARNNLPKDIAEHAQLRTYSY